MFFGMPIEYELILMCLLVPIIMAGSMGDDDEFHDEDENDNEGGT